jgi:hypothetical protein
MTEHDDVDEEYDRLYEAAHNPRQRESLSRVKRACDYLQKTGLKISPTNVERYCTDHQWDGPKAQSIRNSRDVLYRYLLLRQDNQTVDRAAPRKEYKPQIGDETLRAYVALVEQERDLAVAARQRIEAALRTIPGVSLDEVVRIGFGATAKAPVETPRHPNNKLWLALAGLLNETHLVGCGLELYRERVRAITSKTVLLEKSQVEAIRDFLDGVFDIVENRFASNSTLITHWFHKALAVFDDHDRRVVAGENPRVARLGFGPLDVIELATGPGNLVSGDSLVFNCGLCCLCLQCPFSVREPLALLKQLLLELCHLVSVEPVDESLDFALCFSCGGAKRIFHRLRYLGFANAFHAFEE